MAVSNIFIRASYPLNTMVAKLARRNLLISLTVSSCHLSVFEALLITSQGGLTIPNLGVPTQGVAAGFSIIFKTSNAPIAKAMARLISAQSD